MTEAILKTLRYFDLHNHPMTLMELERFLLKPNRSMQDFNYDLFLHDTEGLVKTNSIESKDGFYFLSGRADLVYRRIEAYALYMERLQRTSRLLKILRYVPFVCGVAVGGSLAGMYSTENSDIDFLVIAKVNRIWLSRLFMSGVTQILGVRRYGSKVANRVCLNHYVIEKHALPTDHTDYSAVEYNSLLCLLGPEACHEFIKRQTWLADHLINPPQQMSDSFYTVRSSRLLQPTLEWLINFLGGDLWEKLAGNYQKRRIRTSLTVTVSEQELSFHPDSKGQALLAKMEQEKS